MANNKYKLSRFKRLITHVGVAGSAAAGDSAVTVQAGQRNLCTLYNSTAGAVIPKADADLFPVYDIVMPNEPISVVIDDASATNPLFVKIAYREVM